MRATSWCLALGGAFLGAAVLLAPPGCSSDSSEPATAAGGNATGTTAAGTPSGSGGDGGQGGDGGGGAAAAPFTSQGASAYETQTSIAADDQGGIVVVWIAFFADDTSEIGYAVSRDGGERWTAPRYVASPDGRLASNPVVAVDGDGRFALSWLGFRRNPAIPDEHVYLSLLDEADDSFGSPVVASDDGTSTSMDFDKPTLTADATNDFLITWADFTDTGSLTFARTSDGTSFERRTLAADETFGNLAYLCLDRTLGPTAPLYIVHLTVGATLTLHRSTDGGMNWSALAVPATNVLFQDPTCAVSGDRVWIAYAQGTGFDPVLDTPAETINVIHSPDGGASMDAPVVASDVSGDRYLFPRLLRLSTGKLGIVYYQGRVGQAVDLVIATSSNGTTWETSPIAAAGSMTLDSTLANWLGAYVGFTNGTDAQLCSYTDNSGVKDRIAVAKFVAP